MFGPETLACCEILQVELLGDVRIGIVFLLFDCFFCFLKTDHEDD